MLWYAMIRKCERSVEGGAALPLLWNPVPTIREVHVHLGSAVFLDVRPFTVT